MGQMRFVVSPPERISEEVLQFAYISGFDRTPWPALTRVDGDILSIERDADESGCLTLPWHVEGHGLLGLATATLVQRDEPYRLPLELTRGAIQLLRSQMFEWSSIGLLVPEAVRDKLHESTVLFSRAVVEQESPDSPRLAQEALTIALDAGQQLAAAYTEQSIAVRRRAAGRLNTLLGCELPATGLDEAAARQFLATFNAALVPIPWRDVEAVEGTFSWSIYDRQIEWCVTHGLRVCAGPLLQLDNHGLPHWAAIFEDDFENLVDAANHFVDAAVKRYQHKVDIWQCASRANTSEVLGLSEEDCLRLVASGVHRVGTLAPASARVISIDQPWGEYLGRRQIDFPPIHFADALVRARLEVKAVMLEMNLGCFLDGTLPRPELEVSRLLDYWTSIGLPLVISLSMPSGDGDDPQALRTVSVPPGSWSQELQHEWVARLVPLLLAKPCVQGVFWNQYHDGEPHDFPHAGLVTTASQAKPAMRTLATINTAYLAGKTG